MPDGSPSAGSILKGVRVLDISHFLAGPYCTQVLCDLGAEVIRIEPPGGEVDRTLGHALPGGNSFIFTTRARGKKAITLNLHREDGRPILAELITKSDILVESHGPRAKKAMGVDYSTLRSYNPGIIVVSISAFGLDGPASNRLGNDAVAQSASGIMSYTGMPGDPPLRLQGWVDYAAGTQAALGAVSALYSKRVTGEGQLVDVSLFDVAMGLTVLSGAAAEAIVLGQVRAQDGNNSPVSFGNTFRAKDGWVTIATMGRGWRKFARAIGREDLLEDLRFKDDWSRHENRDVLEPIVARWISQRTVEEANRIMEECAVPCARVSNVAEAISDPQTKARHMVEMAEQDDGTGIPVNGPVLKFSRTPAGPSTTRAPGLGQHNDDIYSSLLGYSAEKMAALKSKGVV